MNFYKRQKRKVQSAKCNVRGNSKFCNLRFAFCDDSGFTLVETLVAVTILMIAIAGPLTVAEKGLSAAIYARDQMIGSYLAQDAMESIKNIVDTNEIAKASESGQSISWLNSPSNWNNGTSALSDCTDSTSQCLIDTINGRIDNSASDCPGNSSSDCPPLSLDQSGYNGNNSGDPSNFTRYFYLQPFNTNGTQCTSSDCDAANVIVTVTWPGDVVGGGGVTLEDTIYDAPIP